MKKEICWLAFKVFLNYGTLLHSVEYRWQKSFKEDDKLKLTITDNEITLLLLLKELRVYYRQTKTHTQFLAYTRSYAEYSWMNASLPT